MALKKGVGFPIHTWRITWGPHALQWNPGEGDSCPVSSSLVPALDPWLLLIPQDPNHQQSRNTIPAHFWAPYLGLRPGQQCWRGGAAGVAPHDVGAADLLRTAFALGELGSPDSWTGEPNQQELHLMGVSGAAWNHLRQLAGVPAEPPPPPPPPVEPPVPPVDPPIDPPGEPQPSDELGRRVTLLEDKSVLLESRSFAANRRLDELEAHIKDVDTSIANVVRIWRQRVEALESWKERENSWQEDHMKEFDDLVQRLEALERGPLPPVPPPAPPQPPVPPPGGNPLPPVSGVPRVSEDPRILAGNLRAEDGPLMAWERWQWGEVGSLGTPPSPTALRIGLSESGSQNHGPMRAAGWLLEAMGTDRRYAESVAYDTIEQFEVQRQEGHKVQEGVSGYNAFWCGASATLAIVGKMATDDALTWGPELWQRALGWWADELDLLRALRTPDGQILHVGTRTRLHEPIGKPIWDTAPAALVAQMLDLRQNVKPWIRLLAAGDSGNTDPACAFGWRKPASVRVAVCLRQVLRAIALGALPPGLLREAAEGRKPRLCEPLWVGEHWAEMPTVRGGPTQVYRAEWRGGLCRTVQHTDLPGFGRHIGVALPSTPAFTPTSPIPPLPELP